MTRTPYLAHRVVSVAALGALAVAACAAQAAAGPTRSTGNGSAQPAYPGFPSAPVTRHAHPAQVPQLQVHSQRALAPIFMPVSWSPLNTGVFGGGFMNGFMPTACSSERAPMTLGELAPGGDTDFAPVSRSMIDPGGAGADPSWLDSLMGSSTYNMPQAPFQGPMGLTGGTSQLAGGLAANCAPGSSFDFSDVQLGL
jgi:hypothetical protein